MTRCANPTIKDLLPDLLHDRLTVAQRTQVDAHLSTCDECRAELTILRQIIAVSVAPRVDVTRIATTLPRYRPRSMWQRAVHSTQLRIAAAIVVLAGGAAVVATVLSRDVAPTRVAVQASTRVDSTVPLKPSTPSATTDSTTAAQRKPNDRDRVPAELALGETVHDLSDAELRTLLSELGTLEAVTPTETEVVVPALGRGSQ